MKCARLAIALVAFFAMQSISQAQKPTFSNLDYVGNGNAKQNLDLYIPVGLIQAAPLVIFIHGGGWSGGAKGGAMGFCDTLLMHGYIVADINYRLSGDSVFPAQIFDCKAAVRWLKSHAQQYKIDTCRVAVTGSSAGGHLASLLGTSGGVHTLESFELGSTTTTSKVHAAIPFYGPSDFLQMQTHTPLTPPDSCTNPLNHLSPSSPEAKLLGCASISNCPDRVSEANPVTYIDSNDPPFKLFHGSFDCSVPVHQSILLDSALTLSGVYSSLVVLPGVGHAFRPDPLQKRDMLNFLNSKLLPCIQTGIEDEDSDRFSCSIYPNPATSHVFVSYQGESPVKYSIINCLGEKVIEEKFINERVDVSGLRNGIYLIAVETRTSVYTTKLIKY